VRVRTRLRGWGGVAGMAAACALAVTAVTLPLTNGGGTHRSGAGAPARPAAPAHQAADGSCDPTASLNPSSGSVNGAAVKRIKARGRLVVGVDQNSYLWGYRNPSTGAIQGFDIDIVKAIAKDILGSAGKVTYKTVPTARRIPALQHREVDMVVRTMTINCERLKQVAFSSVYFESGQQLLMPKASPVTAFDDSVRGKTICTDKGSTGEAYLRKYPHGAKPMILANPLDCLVQVQLGQADGVITDSTLAAGQAAQDPSMHLVGPLLTQEPYGVAMNLQDTDLVRRVNKVLAAYRSGGGNSAWMRSFDRWLAHDMPRPDGPPAAHYRD
jgi:polar amino acid transport system substrate-binding protein